MQNTTSTIINISIDYAEDYPFDFTASHRAYAARCGYEYRQITEHLLPGALPTWSKYPAAEAVILDRRAVMIIDTDAEILPACPAFDALLDSHPDADLFMALGHSFRPNAGMIILRGGHRGAAFINMLLSVRNTMIPQEDVAKPRGDNGHVINLVRHGPFRDKLHVLPSIWNNTMTPCDWDFIRHYTGPMRKWLQSSRLST